MGHTCGASKMPQQKDEDDDGRRRKTTQEGKHRRNSSTNAENKVANARITTATPLSPATRTTHFWLRKTNGVGVPKRTTSQSAKSDSNASVILSHCAGPMNLRSCQAALVPWALSSVCGRNETRGGTHSTSGWTYSGHKFAKKKKRVPSVPEQQTERERGQLSARNCFPAQACILSSFCPLLVNLSQCSF